MNVNLKKTAMALAVATLVASPAAFAQHNQDASANIDHQHRVNEDWDTNVQDIRNFETTVTDNRDYDVTVDDIRNFETNVENNTSNTNVNLGLDAYANVNADVDLVLDAAAVIRYDADIDEVSSTIENFTSNEVVNSTDNYTSNETRTVNYTENTSRYDAASSTRVANSSSNVVTEDVDVDSDIRREQNEHGRSVYLSKDLSVSSDIDINGDITLTGDIDFDSAAIAVVDGRQTIAGNTGNNDTLENTAAIGDQAAGGASGNLGFNVAAGDNNAQDNAAALSAADASFAFGMADAEIFNNQAGANNLTNNAGVANAAGLSGAAFNGASGNINVNLASGNNNAQRNSLAASVATSAYAQASVASDQVSGGNVTNNAGTMTEVQDSITLTIGGTMSGTDGSSASYAGRGASYQMGNIYPEAWGADGNDGNHPDSPRLGHIDMDGDMQGSIDNPYRESDEFGNIGGIAFDTDEAGTIDLSDAEMAAALTGTLDMSYQVAVAATNSATLSGSAFNGASGNIGVNVASGSGNLQSNSLSLAVAQPSTGGGTPDPDIGG